MRTHKQLKTRVGIYAGSFDPPTVGHMWMIEEAAAMFDKLIVALGVNGDLDANITTVFLMPPRDIAEVSSSMVKGLVGPRGWPAMVRPYLPPAVYQQFVKTFRRHASK